MAKKKKKSQAKGSKFGMPHPGGPPGPDLPWGMPPNPGEFIGHPPHPMGPPGPMMQGERFPMGPPMHPMMAGPRNFMMRGPFMMDEGPRFHPHQFEGGPHFHHPMFEDRPMDFHPGGFEGGPPFPQRDFDFRLSGCPPPDFACGPGPGPGPGFYPHPNDDPNYMPPAGDQAHPGFAGPGGYFGPPTDFVGQGPLPGQDGAVPAPSAAPVAPSQQTSDQTMSDNAKSMAIKAAIASAKNSSSFVKPPPGRSLGVISFVGNNYGFIEREDLKKFTFPFDAYFGNRNHLVPGVKVHFTAVKELGKECATDVKVAPGGTEEIDETVYEGVVITVLPDVYVKKPYPGCIRAILVNDPIKLPFGKMDTKATLLMFDRVRFQVLTDIITQITRATNIKPVVPETYQLTKEIREMGVIMNVKRDVCTIMSKLQESINASLSDNIGDEVLSVMDEVEFTVLTIKDTVKAVRLKKVPEGSVVFNSQAQNKIAEAKKKIDAPPAQNKWKPVTTETGHEEPEDDEIDIESEMYEGIIIKTIPKTPEETEEQEPVQGLLESTVAGTQKRLSFRSEDVITQATMLVGDKVYFNMSVNKTTKEEHAVNIEIQPDSFQTDSEEQRKTGIVVKLEENSGCIKTAHDQLIFDFSEVMEDSNLILLEKVEFTIMKSEEDEEVKRAIRIRRLTGNVFTPGPKLEGLGEKEKKKMTIKILDETKDLIQNEAVVKNDVSVGSKKPDKGKVEASKFVKPPTKTEKQDGKVKQDGDRAAREHSRSRENSRRRYSRSRSRSRDRSSSHRKQRSSSRERSYGRYRRSRSRSRDRTHSSRRSRSRSKERYSRSGKKRSRSPEYKDSHRRDRSHSKERSSKRRSPDKKSESEKTLSKSAASLSEDVDDELTQKKKELLQLNELIARKRAIIAMEQNTKTFKDVLEMDRPQGFATFDYQHKTCLENTWMPDLKPAKSILKKHSDPLTGERQASKRSLSTEELVEYPKCSTTTTTTSLYACPVPSWMKESPFAEDEDQELQRKKKQLEELSESIARKRAIVAMKHKVRVFSEEPEEEHTEEEHSDDLEFSAPAKNTWQPEKPYLQPKKSILKKRSEPPAEQSQIATTSTAPERYGHTLFPICQPPQADYSAFSNPSASSHTNVEKSNNQPNALGIFERVINKGSTTSLSSETPPFNTPPGQALFSSMSGSFYGQKSSTEEARASSLANIAHKPSTQDVPTAQPSTSTDQKRNLATQMQRFLNALNNADSSLVSSMLREAKKDPLVTPKPPVQSDKVASKDELYDPFKETEDNEDLLPHERAVQDGSGFSKLVGMQYGTESTAENRFFYGGEEASGTHGGPYSNFEQQRTSKDGLKKLYSQGQDSRSRVGGSISPVQQKPEKTTEDATKKSEHFEKIQSLLQTIGLKLDTSEVSKLADRTRERLYGKAKSPSASLETSDQKEKKSGGRSYRRGSRADSSDSEGVCSVSPARSSNREVYMSYWDSLKHRDPSDDDKGGKKEKDLLNLQMTIKNSPEARQVTPDPQKRASSTQVTQELASTSVQSISTHYTQPATNSSWESSYYLGEDQKSQDPVSPYGSIFPSPLPYPPGIHIPPPGYGSFGMPPPFPGQPLISPPFSTPVPFGPPPTPPFPPPTSLFNMLIAPKAPDFSTTQVKVKAPPTTRCLKTIQTVTTNSETPAQASAKPPLLTVQKALISIKTVDEDTPKEDELKQAAPMTEEDIKAKQKKRLEQFNQRMRLKKEQQMEAQRARGQSQKSAPGKVTRNEVKNVWICGHSLVFWAEKRATSPEIGMQLGMDPNAVRIWWKGVQGMTWQQLLPQLLQLKDNWPKPDVIIIHLGGNDLGKTTPEAFLAAVKNDLISIKSIFPNCALVWSEILPRMFWRHSEDNEAVDTTRQAINKSICSIIAELSGYSVSHENIMPGLDLGLYRPDGVHLSGKGIDTFNLNMQDLLEKWESEINESEPSDN